MDTMYFTWLDNPVDVDKDLQLPQFFLVSTPKFDCSQNYTAGSYTQHRTVPAVPPTWPVLRPERQVALASKLTRKLCYRKDDRTMRLIKLLPVSILTTQSDNTHMVCCWKVHLYHLVLIAGLYGQK